jgi:hypothetical protein
MSRTAASVPADEAFDIARQGGCYAETTMVAGPVGPPNDGHLAWFATLFQVSHGPILLIETTAGKS